MRSVRSFASASQASCAAMAIALASVSTAGHAQAFQGTPTVVRGGSAVYVSTAPGSTTVELDPGVTTATINWVPTNTSGGGTIDFLPANTTANFSGVGTQTILNRILPLSGATPTDRVVALNGAITSTPGTGVWVYNAGGIMVGSGASINVGSLVLTTADPTPTGDDTGEYFSPATRSALLRGTAGSTSSISIDANATINAANQSGSYVLVFAPQIAQHGKVFVDGGAALVAGETASFTIDPSGLFTINMQVGTSVAGNALVQDGTIGNDPQNPLTAAAKRRVYLMAVPKNDAMTSLVAAGGTIGFTVAGSASEDDNAIVLSAGPGITDTSGGLALGNGALASVSLTGGTVLNNTTSASPITLTGNTTFNRNLSVLANNAGVDTGAHTLTVGGDLKVIADGDPSHGAGTASVISGGLLQVGGALTISATDAFSGTGGAASLTAGGGSVAVTGFTQIVANGSFLGASQLPIPPSAQGGRATLAANSGGIVTLNGLNMGANADGMAGAQGVGADARGGQALLQADGAGSHITSNGDVSVIASGAGGNDQTSGIGGGGRGGSASLAATAGGIVTVAGKVTADARGYGGDNVSDAASANAGSGTGGAAILRVAGGTFETLGSFSTNVMADANGGRASGAGSNAGSATGGSATLSVTDGVYRTGDGFSTFVTADANSSGNFNTASGTNGAGGTATGGSALIQTGGSSGQITLNYNVQSGGGTLRASALAVGGSASSGAGGNATGGQAIIATTGAGQSITAPQVQSVQVFATAMGGGALGAASGKATGGLAQITIDGGTALFDAGSDVSLGVQARSGDTDISPGAGAATGGRALLSVTNGGSLTTTGSTEFTAGTIAGRNGDGSSGDTTGGTVLIQNAGTLSLGTSGSDVGIDTGGTGKQGYTLISTAPAGRTVFGTGPSGANGDIVINNGLQFGSDDPIRISAAGNLTVNGNITVGVDDHLDLIADNTGSGVGTVTLAPGAIFVPFSGAVNIYSNPTALGAPTDYSAGVSGTTPTSYQLINSASQLQQIGNFLAQNFALSRDVDASATQTWNGGAGFVPIGGSGTPFTGKFDGLGHQISALSINRPGSDYVGLFGNLDAGAVIANVGLTGAQVTGRTYVGALIGQVLGNSAGAVTISNTFATNTQVTGASDLGGLVGSIVAPGGTSVAVADSHADASITATGSGTYAFAGGLIGFAGVGTISRSFATGTITAGGLGTIGGLMGLNQAATTDSYATTTITAGAGAFEVGGLAGANYGTLNRVYATGAVSVGSGSQSVGGLVGLNDGLISEGLASGMVTAPGASAGGLVGNARDSSGSAQNSYWDVATTGQSIGIYGAFSAQATNVTPIGGSNGNPYSTSSYGNLSSGNWVYLSGGSRPIGAWEVPTAEYGVATIASAHQVNLVASDPAGSYRLSQNIDMSGTSVAGDIWNPNGFSPLNQFSGVLDGAGHSLLNLRIAGNPFADTALILSNSGTIRGIGLWNVNITGGTYGNTAALAAANFGAISESYATGVVSGGAGGTTGGLVGANLGTVTNAYTSVAVNGVNGDATGGLAGRNAGSISYSYASGTTTGVSTGALIGRADPTSVTISNRYDVQANPVAACGATAGNACTSNSGLTTAQMMQASSFSDWNIASSGGSGTTWRIYEGQTTPLLTRYLTAVTAQVSDAAYTYDGSVKGPGFVLPGARAHISGAATFTGSGRNVGSYMVSYAGGLYSDQLGYDIVATPQTAAVTINPAALTLAAVSDTRAYNATTSSAGQVQVSGLQGADSIANLVQVFDSANAGSRSISVAAGFAINDGNNGGNYAVTLNGASGTITKAALTLAAVTDRKVYDKTVASAGIVQVIGLQGSDSVTGVAQNFDSVNAGNRTLTVAGGYTVNDGNNGGNYAVLLAGATGSITPATLTLAAASGGKTYDATTGSAGQVQVTGLKGTDTVTGLTQAYDSANAGNRALAVATGYSVNDGNGGGNYAVSLTNASGIITPAALTLAAVTDSRTYDATTGSTGQVQVSGLKGGDTVAGLTQMFDSGNAGGRTLMVAGGYTINDGNGGGNYAVTTSDAQGNIGRATLTLTAVADSRAYDATIGSGGRVQVVGLKGSDSVAGLAQAFDSVNAGPRILRVSSGYTINDGNGGGNYAVSLGGASGTITPAALRLAAVTDAKTYDATASSTDKVQVSGLKGGDSVTGLAQAFDSANAGSRILTVGQGYAVSDGNGGANYRVSLATATGTITPASLTLTYTANSASSVYGNAIGVLDGTVRSSGLIGTDTLALATNGVAIFSTSAGSVSAVGRYAIVGGGLATNGNYQINSVQAAANANALTITTRPITIVADAQTRAAAFANPQLTYAVSGQGQAAGLVNGDQLSGALATSATNNSVAGNYAITQGTLAASSNYALTYVGANLTVTPGVTVADLQQLPREAQIIAAVAPNIAAQMGATAEVLPTAEAQKEEQKAVANSAKPAAVRAILINDGSVSIPQPVDEAVTSNGSSGLWGPR